jgi:hypothetical protein
LYITKIFNISIENSRTAFDAVIQEISNSEVSIAIANTGKYTANSVIVRIPEQDYYTTTGTNGQMVGNLESGDYTIVSFSLSSKIILLSNSQTQKKYQNSSTEPLQRDLNQKQNLSVDIYYTDNIGERRIVTLALPISLTNLNGLNSTGMNNLSSNFQRKNPSSWSIWHILLVLIAIFGLSFLIIKKKFPSQSKELIERIFKKKKKKISSNEVPDWIKNTKEKERK